MKKLFLLLGLITATIVAFFLFNNYHLLNTKIQSRNDSGRKIYVYQKVQDGLKLDAPYYKYQVPENYTALSLINKTSSVKVFGSGENTYVIEINQKKADDKNKQYWAFYINGKLSQVGAGSYKLQNNDKIEWKLENY